VIPLRDVIPSRTFPAVTLLLVAVNALVFVWQLFFWADDWHGGIRAFGVVPAAVTVRDVLTSMVVHAGWLHVGANLLVLWLFGENVEDRMGHGRFLAFYLLCGAVAICAHVAFEPRSAVPAVGASAAAAGVMGAYFRLYRRSRVLTLVPIFMVVPLVEVPAILFLALWALVQLAAEPGAWAGAGYTGAVGGMSPVGLLAGFATGALLVVVFRRPERASVDWWAERPPRRTG
jgi:membrane associated rhomboid family serine protease